MEDLPLGEVLREGQVTVLVDREPPHPAVAGPADALLARGLSALVGRRRQPREASDLTAISKLSPAKELLYQYPGAVYPNSPQIHQLLYLFNIFPIVVF